jgi:TonB family protein
MSWLAFLEQNALRGTIVLTAAFAAATALRHASAALRALVWTSACAALSALPVALLVVPKWSPLPAQVAARPAAEGQHALAQVDSGGDAWQVPIAAPVSREPRFDWLARLWVLGCAAAAAWFLLCFARASRMVHRACPASYARVALEDAMAALGIRRPARVLEASAAPMPLAWGVLNPVAILPTGAQEWPDERLRAVLLHELVHAQRFDLAAQAVAQAACCLFWFHPLAWLAARQFRKEREHACDDAVLSHMAGPDYAGHLMELARGMALRRPRWAGAPAMAQASHLESRVRAVLDSHRDRRPLTRGAALAAAALVCAVLLPAAAISARAKAIPAESPTAVASPVALPAPVAEAAPEPVAAVSATETFAPEPEPAPAAAPQSASGVLYGVVRDPSLAVVPNCRISAKNLDSSGTEVAVTNAAGEYRIPGLPPGRYALEFQAAGFSIARKEVVVAAGSATQAGANLEIGHGAEAITVTAPRPGAVAPEAAGAGPQSIRVGGNVQQFMILRKAPPVYPEDLRLAGIEGRVVVRAIISKDGDVLSPQSASADVHPRLVEAAINAVRQWKYRPTLLNGQPIETPTEIVIVFSLE